MQLILDYFPTGIKSDYFCLMENTIKLFLKFGREEHIVDLLENGTIFMNTVEYFRNVEDKDEDLRADDREGDVRVVNSLPGSFTIPSINYRVNYQKVHYRIKPKRLLGNIYSLYSVSSYGFPNPLDFIVDKRNFRFGSHCLIIKDCQYFFNRINQALCERNQPYEHDFVKYYDKNAVSKNLSIFDKCQEFEYQKEFRFFASNDILEPIKLQIGDLSDYAEIHSSRAMETLTLIR